ncbi:MAG: hypothetical protein WD734_06850 [Dehalococcoidia bacterium]
MYSGMIGKIDKAHRYAEDRSRFDIHSLAVTIHGNNGDHDVRFEEGGWRCDCDYFRLQDSCAHTMALEVMLDGMVRPDAASLERASA